MNQTYVPWIVGAVTVVIIGALAFWHYGSPSPVPLVPIATSTQSVSGATTTNVSGVSGTGSFTVSAPASATISVPDYQAPFTCASDMTDTACAQLKARNATLVAQIAANETDAAAWINLGALRKINNDYRGAEAAWIYVTKLYPSNSTAYANLGDLYMNFLHDYTRAETNYLLATKYAPTDASLYQTLFTLYTSTSYKPSATAAEDILKKGIAANPRAIDLEVVLARYYKSLGRIADAKVQYDAAIANAKSQGQTALAAQIHEEEGQ